MLALLSKVSKIYYSIWKHWKSTFSITNCRLTPTLQGTPANIRINLILPETRVIDNISAAESIFIRGLQNALLWKTVRRSRSFTVIDFDIKRKRACDFLLVISSNLDLILLRFKDITSFLPKQRPYPYVFLGLDCQCWGSAPRRP